MHAVAKVEPGSTFAMSRCDSLRQPATGVSPVAKLVATHVAAIFHSINRALVGPSSTFATACIATWETQVASWAFAHHDCVFSTSCTGFATNIII